MATYYVPLTKKIIEEFLVGALFFEGLPDSKLRWLLEQGHSHYLGMQGGASCYRNSHNELLRHKNAGGVHRF